MDSTYTENHSTWSIVVSHLFTKFIQTMNYTAPCNLPFDNNDMTHKKYYYIKYGTLIS